MVAYMGKYVTSPYIFYLFPAAFGGIFPDFIEGKPPQDKTSLEYQQWQKYHRQYSHWFVIYLIAFIFVYSAFSILVNNYGYIKVANEILTGAIFFFAGCLIHLLLDSICGKIPSFNPRKKIGIHLFTVGTTAENVISLILLLIILSIFLHRI